MLVVWAGGRDHPNHEWSICRPEWSRKRFLAVVFVPFLHGPWVFKPPFVKQQPESHRSRLLWEVDTLRPSVAATSSVPVCNPRSSAQCLPARSSWPLSGRSCLYVADMRHTGRHLVSFPGRIRPAVNAAMWLNAPHPAVPADAVSRGPGTGSTRWGRGGGGGGGEQTTLCPTVGIGK